MDIKESWRQIVKELVDMEIEAANGKRPVAYAAVAAKMHLKSDFIYQIYAGKPESNPKSPSIDAMTALVRSYRDSDNLKIRALLRRLDVPGKSLQNDWPFESIDAQKIIDLPLDTIKSLEESLLMAAKIMKVDIMSKGAARQSSGFE